MVVSGWISYTTEILILYFGIKDKFAFKLNAFKLILPPMSMALLIGVLEPLFGASHPYIVHGFYILFGGVLLLWAYWKEITVIDFFNKRLIK